MPRANPPDKTPAGCRKTTPITQSRGRQPARGQSATRSVKSHAVDSPREWSNRMGFTQLGDARLFPNRDGQRAVPHPNPPTTPTRGIYAARPSPAPRAHPTRGSLRLTRHQRFASRCDVPAAEPRRRVKGHGAPGPVQRAYQPADSPLPPAKSGGSDRKWPFGVFWRWGVSTLFSGSSPRRNLKPQCISANSRHRKLDFTFSNNLL